MSRIEPRLGFTRVSVDDLMSQLPNRYREKYEKGIGIAKPKIIPISRASARQLMGGFGSGKLTNLDGIPFETLEDAFGPPDESGSPDGKVQVEWFLKMPSGKIINIYDYRISGSVYENEYWSIGGNARKEDVAVLHEYLQHYPEDSPSYE